jgi:membrane associated rhomboid family serine protease
MSVLLGGLAVLLVVIWLVTIGDLVRRRLGTQRTIAWLLIVVIVPYAGAAVYWFCASRRTPPAALCAGRARP